MDDHRELQLLPDEISNHSRSDFRPETQFSGRPPDFSSISPSDNPPRSPNLQLSISLQPTRPSTAECTHSQQGRDCNLAQALRGYEEAKSDMSSAQALKQQAEEQLRLATVKRAYAEQVRELTKREMELAESEFARARRLWGRAREEAEKAQMMKEQATRRIDSTCMEITCQACRQQFRL